LLIIPIEETVVSRAGKWSWKVRKAWVLYLDDLLGGVHEAAGNKGRKIKNRQTKRAIEANQQTKKKHNNSMIEKLKMKGKRGA
jgi:hypothetical protein